MKRIFIFGAIASGKTTLAEQISEKLKIPFYSTDDLVFNSSWKRHNDKERNEKLKKIIKQDKWIIEGTHKRDWILPTLRKADFVVLLALPRHTLIQRIITRHLKRRFNKQPSDNILNLLKWAYQYKKEDLPIYLRLIKQHKKQFIVLKNKKQINNFLASLKK